MQDTKERIEKTYKRLTSYIKTYAVRYLFIIFIIGIIFIRVDIANTV